MRNAKLSICWVSDMRFLVAALLGILWCTNQAFSLPIGFGINQGELEYDLLKGPNFKIYHDSRTPHEAQMTLNSLESAKPYMEFWFGIARDKPLPVILSAVTENASFANLVTDAIELQTGGQGDRDLFWHEYTHASMYVHLQNFLGPAGSVLHLFWMPAWFIEGLAETVSASVGSDVQASIERYEALTGKWPTYDRLHSLYGGNDFFLSGYATSGAFVSWILRNGKKNGLPELLRDFFKYTLPQYFVFSCNPFSNFLPMDEALQRFSELDGKALYERYKQEAQAFWSKNAKGPLLVRRPGARLELRGLGNWQQRDGKLMTLAHKDRVHNQFATLEFDPQTGWLKEVVPTEAPAISSDFSPSAFLIGTDFILGVRTEQNPHSNLHRSSTLVLNPGAGEVALHQTAAWISGLVEHARSFSWLETAQEHTRVCALDKNVLQGNPYKAFCFAETTLPQTLTYLGNRPDRVRPNISAQTFYALREQTMTGDRYSIQTYSEARPGVLTPFPFQQGGTPRSVAVLDDDLWVLIAQRTHSSLRKYANDGRCLSEIDLADYPVRINGLPKGELAITLYAGSTRAVLRVRPSTLPAHACVPATAHVSPLLYAMRRKDPTITLSAALDATSIWRTEDEPVDIQDAVPLDQVSSDLAKEERVTRPAPWEGRHILTIPWIGGDDPQGTQFGIFSVPLMDNMQNEELRVSLLFGLKSKFPATDVTLTSNRFWPTLNLSAFRRQVWNGDYLIRADNSIKASYLDDRGVRFAAEFPWYFGQTTYTLSTGMLASYRKPIIGPSQVLHGTLYEPFIGAGMFTRLSDRVSTRLHLNSRVAPGQINSVYDYNVLSGDATLSFPMIGSSSGSLGLAASRTRGKSGKTPNLREVYTPLRTFVPGTGGGFNQNSYPLAGHGSLFSARFGDTQVRTSANFTVPIVRDLDKYLWVFYFQRLDFSAFLNYGGAWYYDFQNYKKSMITAHGYSMDLQFDNKGVKLNAGIGAGQVVRDKYQVFVKGGFDALF